MENEISKEISKKQSNQLDNNSKKNSYAPNLKKTFDFKIAGVSYKIKSSHDDETVKSLIKYVDQKVGEAMAATKNSSFQNAAVLAALNIAEELILLKRKAVKELQTLEEKASKLSSKIENSKVNKS